MIAANPKSQLDSIAQMEAQLLRCEASIRRMPNGDDIFQKVCLRCLAQTSARDWGQNQYGYIHRVALHVVIDENKREFIRQNIPIQFVGESQSNEDGPFEIVIKREAASLLYDRIALLPPTSKRNHYRPFL